MSSIRAHFDAIAPGYDRRTAEDWTPNRHLHEVLVDTGCRAGRALDLGAGTGQTAATVRAVLPDVQLHLVDISPAMLERASTLVPGATTHVGDLDDFLARERGRYDLVVSMGVLEMVPDVDATLRRAGALVSPGGRIVVSHEVLVHGSPVQGTAHDVVRPPTGDVEVRRHDPLVVERALGEAGLTLDVSRLLVAYHREQEHPVVFHLASAVRS